MGTEAGRKSLEKLADRKITWMRHLIDADEVKKEAHAMRLKLQDGCNEVYDQKWGWKGRGQK